jgi:hypothetical protein
MVFITLASQNTRLFIELLIRSSRFACGELGFASVKVQSLRLNDLKVILRTSKLNLEL